jgi:hypothetical protein
MAVYCFLNLYCIVIFNNKHMHYVHLSHKHEDLHKMANWTVIILSAPSNFKVRFLHFSISARPHCQLVLLQFTETERSGVLVSIPISHSGRPMFNSPP